eukprot:270992_1
MSGIFELPFGRRSFRILKPWPTESLTSTLDASQMEALRQILTKKIALVQGPPGTGKTFVTLQALRVLVDNMQYSDPPLLVVSLTNHALDQLLEGIYKFEKRIVRIGSRTESDEMKECSLYQRKYEYLNSLPMRDPRRWILKNKLGEMDFYVKAIKRILRDIRRICNPQVALSVEDVEHYGLLTESQLFFLENYTRSLQLGNLVPNPQNGEMDEDWQMVQAGPNSCGPTDPVSIWLFEDKIRAAKKARKLIAREKAGPIRVDPNAFEALVPGAYQKPRKEEQQLDVDEYNMRPNFRRHRERNLPVPDVRRQLHNLNLA